VEWNFVEVEQHDVRLPGPAASDQNIPAVDIQIKNRRIMSGSNDPNQLRTYPLPVAIISHDQEI